ncbi:Acylphosphatase [ANME-1 cluster archaeon GoMg1]|nr:Acylphosphatase [ANME-1 cluster archaeon GoMg1]
MVGFRTFIKNAADSFGLKGFAENLPDGDVKIVCEGEKDKITEFIDYIKQNTPSFAAIENITMEYESYRGEFTTFERRGTDVPREEGEILTVLKSFDAKAEKMVVILSAMNEKLGRIDERQDKTVEILEDVKEDTSAMREKQDKTLEKQDRTIGILEDMRADMGEITNALTFLKEIHRETVELREKYELLSRDVEAIKMKMGV